MAAAPKKTATKKVAPTPIEIAVSYSAGVKCNLGEKSYESADYHISETHRFDVSGMDTEAVEEFATETYNALRERIDERIEEVYMETSVFASKDDD